MIKIEKLRFHYSNREFVLVIDQFEIQDGEKLAIVGPSGSGKTTLLDLMAGIRIPTAGSIQFDGQSVNHMSDSERRRFRASQIGLVFQEFELLEYLSVYDNIRLPFLVNRKINRPESVADRIKELAKRVAIEDKLFRKPLKLSQGEKQRVAICRALIHRPKLLLADEPTGNLDLANKQKIISLLIEQAENEGATLVVVTHDQSLIDNFDRVVDVTQLRSA